MVLEPRERVPIAPDVSRDRIGQMVRAMTELGPNIAQISSKLRIPKETLRYWYKGLLKRGFAVQGIPNYEALGLKRVVCVVGFDDVVAPFADSILTSMSETAYLGTFARTMPDNFYVINASVPEEYVGKWAEFMDSLRDKGLFTSLEILTFDWVRSAPMSVDNYDFDSDRWEFDWSNAKPDRNALLHQPSSRTPFDSVDLAMIKQLQIDANKSLVDIRDELKINYKTLTWHWREHLKAESLLRGYQVNWAGTRYDEETQIFKHSTHKYLPIELIMRDLSDSERLEIMGKVNSLPFLWLEAAGRNYYCKTIVPMTLIAQAMQFVREVLAPVKSRSTWFLMDQTHALSFSISPSLHSDQEGWLFDLQGLLEKYGDVVLKIKGEEG